jgi:hypothetical protein
VVEWLSPAMQKAMSLLTRADYLPGVMCSEGSCLMDGQAWINWQTAEALEQRGLVRIERIDGGGDIYLPICDPQTKGEPRA